MLVTGAARGIGAGVARDLAAKGAKVALVGLEADELAKVAADCGPDAGAWEADVTSWADLEKATAAIVARYGRIDVVLANAGIAATGFTRSIDPAAFERVINVDLLGVWRTVRVTLPHLIKSKGYALLVSSAAAIVHIPGNAAYSAAKAGVEAFANSLRAEVRHLGVGVGVVHPTWIATDMVNSADEHPVFGRLRGRSGGLAGKTYPAVARGRPDLLGHREARQGRARAGLGRRGEAVPRAHPTPGRVAVPQARAGRGQGRAGGHRAAWRGRVEPGRARRESCGPPRGCAITGAMSSRRGQIRMTADEIVAFLAEGKAANFATIGPNGRPHLVALWYVPQGNVIETWTFAKSQKAANLRRLPQATILVERGDIYAELRGVSMECDVELVDRRGEDHIHRPSAVCTATARTRRWPRQRASSRGCRPPSGSG